MKIKSSVLFGLIVVICAISGFSLLKRLTHEVDEWRPSDLYSSTNVARRSTYSVVSSAPVSYSEALPTVSSGSGSMFRRRAVSSYAPASGLAGQSSMTGTASYSQSPIAYSQRLHTTSSAEFRSFGGGGNAGGGVSMSGGTIKSTSSSIAPATSLSISMPSTSMYAYNTNRNGSSASDMVASMSGDIAMASSYQGIGNTTGGTMRGISGRKNAAPSFNDPWWKWFDTWMSQYGGPYSTGEGSYTFDRYSLESAYNDFISTFWNSGMGEAPSYDEWLDWYLQAISDGGGSHNYNDHTYFWQPVGDIWPLFVMMLLYAGYVMLRKRKASAAQND